MNDVSFNFAPAVRTNTAVILALAGASGSGKTKSALLLATGLCGDHVGPGDVLLIDSEGDRGLHYAPSPGEKPDFKDTFVFSHYSWRPPYTPESLRTLLDAAALSKFKVVIVDSMSDEHEGEGGLCDMAEAEISAQRKKGWEVNTAAAWSQPKAAHKHKIIRWLRTSRCHVIFCLRADEKIDFQQVVKDGKRRTVVVPRGWTPVCEKRLLFEVTTSLLFTPDQPGVPKPIKLYDKHAKFFPQDRQVSREAGRALAMWAAGGKPSAPPEEPPPAETLPAEQNQEGGFKTLAKSLDHPKPPAYRITGGRGGDIVFQTIEEWRGWWLDQAQKISRDVARLLYERNETVFDDYRDSNQGAVNEVVAALRKRFS